MIPTDTLIDIRDRLMESMTDLYKVAMDDEQAHSLAHALVHIYDDIEFELTIRGGYGVSDASV